MGVCMMDALRKSLQRRCQGVFEENGKENVAFITYSREVTVARRAWVQNNVNQRHKLCNYVSRQFTDYTSHIGTPMGKRGAGLIEWRLMCRKSLTFAWWRTSE